MTMDTTSSDRERPLAAPPPLILPDASRIFLDRSRRLTALAQGHSLAGWLTFLGRLTMIQHEQLQEYPFLFQPIDRTPPPAGKKRTPPLADLIRPEDPAWRGTLTVLARDLAPHAPAPAQATLERLRTMDAAALEDLAERILRIDLDGEDAEFLPFVAAALQVHSTALAARLDRTKIAPAETPGTCPCCDFPAAAGIVRTDSRPTGLRYLHCALCNTEWHLTRVTCAACGDSSHIAYLHIEGSDESVRAETCDMPAGVI